MPLNLKTMCRLCMANQGVHLYDIFTDDADQIDPREIFQANLASRIQTMMHVEVNRNDGLSRYVCSSCIYNVNRYYLFRETCLEAMFRTKKILETIDSKEGGFSNCSINDEEEVPILVYESISSLGKNAVDPLALPDEIREEPDVKNCLFIPKNNDLIFEPKKNVNKESTSSSPKRSKSPAKKPKLSQPIGGATTGCNSAEGQGNADVPSSTANASPAEVSSKTGVPLKYEEHPCGRPNPSSHINFPELPTEEDFIVHLDNGSYACRDCQKVFNHKSSLKRHYVTHTNARPYQCKFCEKYFTDSSNLVKHIRYMHSTNKRVVCSSCKKEFKSPSALSLHKERMHKKQPKKDYKCDVCSYTGASLGEVTVHKNAHHRFEPVPSTSVQRSEPVPSTSGHRSEPVPSTSVQRSEPVPSTSIHRSEPVLSTSVHRSEPVLSTSVHRSEPVPSTSVHKNAHDRSEPVPSTSVPKNAHNRSEPMPSTNIPKNAHNRSEPKPSASVPKNAHNHSEPMPSTSVPKNAHNRSEPMPSTSIPKNAHNHSEAMPSTSIPKHAHNRSEPMPSTSVPKKAHNRTDPMPSTSGHNNSHCSEPVPSTSGSATETSINHLTAALTGTSLADKMNVVNGDAATDCSAEYPIICQICLASFQDTESLDAHKTLAHDVHKFQCPHCPEAFMLRKKMEKHVKAVHTSREFKCSLCSESFSTDSARSQHLLTHSTTRSSRAAKLRDNLQCEYCRGAFLTVYDLYIHKETCGDLFGDD